MYNALSDPYLISQYHEEYLTLINRYCDLKRPGAFIRYYNIDYNESIKHPETNATYDIYSSSDIKFNIFDLTPTFNLSPIVSSTVFSGEKKGQMFDGVSSIVTHTIKLPRIHDLVVFYDPIKSGEIYRVNNFRASINALYSTPEVTWYEMDLEVAPIRDTSKLKISKHYIYDTIKEEYLDYKFYTNKMNVINQISAKISLILQYYSRVNDLYLSGIYVPLIANQSIIYFKNKFNNSTYLRIFDDLIKPYGFEELFPDLLADIDFDQSIFEVYNTQTKLVEDYEWDREEESDLNTLFSLSQELYDLSNNSVFS